MSIFEELINKTNLIEDIFKILTSSTKDTVANPEMQITKIQDSILKTKTEFKELDRIINPLEIQKFYSDEMVNPIIDIANCIKEIYKTLEIAQEFAIKYVEAKYINNNYFLQRRYYDELIKCTSCNFVDATNKFSTALEKFYLCIPENN